MLYSIKNYLSILSNELVSYKLLTILYSPTPLSPTASTFNDVMMESHSQCLSSAHEKQYKHM